MDIFVHAFDREPIGIVVVKAMSLGKPVVVPSRGPEEIIQEGEDGLLVAPNVPVRLTEAILTYLSALELAARIGLVAR